MPPFTILIALQNFPKSPKVCSVAVLPSALPIKTGFAAELSAKSSFSDFRSDESLFLSY
jgi:hypothetical protein